LRSGKTPLRRFAIWQNAFTAFRDLAKRLTAFRDLAKRLTAFRDLAKRLTAFRDLGLDSKELVIG
jgi:hypothetical protein